MLEVLLSRKEATCSAGEKEEEVCLAGEKEEDALKERENTWEKGRMHVRGRAQAGKKQFCSQGVQSLS